MSKCKCKLFNLRYVSFVITDQDQRHLESRLCSFLNNMHKDCEIVSISYSTHREQHSVLLVYRYEMEVDNE